MPRLLLSAQDQPLVRNSCLTELPSRCQCLCTPHLKFRQCLGPFLYTNRCNLSHSEVSSSHVVSAAHLLCVFLTLFCEVGLIISLILWGADPEAQRNRLLSQYVPGFSPDPPILPCADRPCVVLPFFLSYRVNTETDTGDSPGRGLG